ncbi:GNAT family N-acetyltransferase [Anaerocolumna sedimenticola]|uniref:GNAT family N-acetyltransferase n=1 Tax=Anaerocolumna sedimenticola TaxID=2696063 RepID=A0A6P1TR09_9FIRM|nr:GNAT family N-acetyltransferase [Anaerocolumna sedimenticola]QHQ62331.1 GNAT family N-acetyltransferase [Anaerocolumna sedimenticola]
MIELEKGNRYKIEKFFITMHDTVILTCLQGHMGRAFTDDLQNPACAMVQGGDFCFLNGDATKESTNQLISQILNLTELPLAFVITDNTKIGDKIEQIYGDNCKKIKRYSIKKKKDEFNIEYLRSIVRKLPNEYTISPINEIWYDEALKEAWSKDFVSNFLSKEDYLTRGIGRVITYNGKIISGASSYTIYNDGIEIEIATREEFRNKGLAQIAGAALILACREKGLYPSWDAANLTSVHLAEKLGYEYDKPYDTYMLRRGDIL